MTEKDLEDAIFKVYTWQHSRTECFTDHLFDLWMHADAENKIKLGWGFPVEVEAIEMWYYSKDPEQFFQDYLRHRIMKLSDEEDLK